MTSVSSHGDQQSFLELEESPAEAWEQNAAARVLDELFTSAQRYRQSSEYWKLMQFVARFRWYAPFNAMLVHTQMSGAVYVATASRWMRDYQRYVRPTARPLLILQPMGPVMFVFDVSETDPLPEAPPLPPDVTDPFAVRRGQIKHEFSRTTENAKRDGIRIWERRTGSQHAGDIRIAGAPGYLSVLVKQRPKPDYARVPVRYELTMNSAHSLETKYVTLAHELAHLYCGHLGTPDEKWWPDRRGLAHEQREFEAESVAYLVCRRLGLDSPAETYLAEYAKDSKPVPTISMDIVMRAAGNIERMGQERLPLRPTERQK